MTTYKDHVGVYGNYYSDNKQESRMEVSHTLDGYWILSGCIGPKYENVQATMAKAKEQFIKANPLIDSAKVVVIDGEFKWQR